MTPTILAAGILPQTTFNVGVPQGALQNLAYIIDVNPVTVPQDGTHVLSLLLKIVSPSGVVMYKNAGYDAGNFGSPDSLTGSYVTPFLTGTLIPESGTYVINIKAQYVDSSGAPVTTLATVIYNTQELCMSCLPSAKMNLNVNCSDILFTITDTTNYCLTGYSFEGVEREIDATPPSGSNQPVATGTDKVLQIDNGSEGNGQLWNGLYSITLTAIATYKQGSTTIIQSISYTTTKTVSCINDICTINCLLAALMDDYVTDLNTNPAIAASLLPKIAAGSAEVQLAKNAKGCGMDYQQFITNFYKVTGFKIGCKTCSAIEPVGAVSSDCGCGGSGGGGGAPGQRGSIWIDGSGVPNNSLGLDNDQYLNIANGNVYWKVSGAWVLKMSLIGPTGAAGAAGATGAAGANGTGILWNAIINPQTSTTTTGPGYVNTGAGVSDVYTETILAARLLNAGDEVRLVIDILVPQPYPNIVLIKLGGVTIGGAYALSAASAYSINEILISVVDISGTKYVQTQGKYTSYIIAGAGIESEFLFAQTQTVWVAATDLDLEIDFSALASANMSRVSIIDSPYYKK